MVFLKTIFSSEESSESLRKSIYRKFNRTFSHDPQEPNYYRQYLHKQCDVCMSMTTLAKEELQYDYNETKLIRAYFKEPKLENALALLQITKPLQSLKRKKNSTSIYPHSYPASTTTPTRRGGRPPFSQDIMDAIIYTDTLHDLNFSVKQWIFNHVNPSVISPQTIHRATATIDIGNAWLNACDMDITRDFSTSLSDIFMRWNSDELTLCFDGFLEYLQAYGSYELFTKTMYGTCILMICISEMIKTKRPFKKLIIVDGLFHSLDGFYFIDFIDDYIRYLGMMFQGVVIVKEIVTPIQPKYIPMRIDSDAQDIVLTNGTRIPYSSVRTGWMYTGAENAHTFHLPYTKKDLNNLFRNLINDPDPKIQKILESAAHVNFFRDAYRIDLAIQKDWAYITHDRLAFLFYSILAKHLDVPQRGLFGARDNNTSLQFLVAMPK